jgi:hypothetical protein
MEAVCTARESEEVAHVDAELKRSVWRFLNLPPPHDPLELRPESGASWGGTRARKTDDALLAHVPVLPITRAPGAPRPRGRNPGRRQHRLRLRECLPLGVRPEGNEFVRPGPDLRGCRVPPASLTSGTVRPDCS